MIAPRRLRAGLRQLVILAFAVGSLALSVALAASTYWSARHYLVEQRERTALRQSFADASYVRDRLRTSGALIPDALGSISPAAGTVILVQRYGKWYSSSLELSSDDLPPPVLSHVAAGDASFEWTRANGEPALVVGVPMASVGAAYYEVSVTAELDSTLHTLRIALVASAIATTLGGALLGRLAARRVLAPLNKVTSAAAKISAGDLDTRLSPTDDGDLTALVAAFNTMVDELEARIQRESRFVADVSHELRSPMTTFATGVSILAADETLPARPRETVNLLEREIARFQRSLAELLELSRLDAGVDEPHRTVVDLADLVAESLHARAPHSPPVVATAEPPDVALPVNVDKRRVSRALINLFDNADRHGGGLVSVSVTRLDRFGDIHVRDNGPGIAPEHRTRVFERFARVGSRGSASGAGLGLSIVAETVRLEGGAVWCVCVPGDGGHFVLRLPLARAEDELAGGL